jgi:hypothetical protein
MRIKLRIICILICLLFINISFAQKAKSSFPYTRQVQNQLSQKNIEIQQNDIEDLYIERQYFDKKTNVTHVYIGQRFKGIKINNAISSLALRDEKEVYFGNAFITNIASKVNIVTPTITPTQAIEKVLTHFNIDTLKNKRILSSNNNEFVFDKEGISQYDIPVNLRFTSKNDKLILSWTVDIYTLDSQHYWNITLDATNGEIININDLVLKCDFGIPTASHNHDHDKIDTRKPETFSLFKSSNFLNPIGSQYNVFSYPIESPNHGARQLVVEPARAASPYGWHDVDGVAGAEYTITRGNNVYAYEDIAATQVPGFSPDGGSALDFNFTLDLNQSATTNTPTAQNQSSAITNLFYWNNILHDVWYNYGFDEAAGNFQQNNYGNGGAGNDAVNAEAFDGSGTNNANFGTPPDGNAPRMQMYLWGTNTTANLTINSPAGIAGNYQVVLATSFGGSLTSNLTGDLVLVDDGTALPSSGCSAITNNIAGKIAVIDRGTCSNVQKALNAQNAGAIAVIVVNNSAGSPIDMGGINPSITIPCVMIGQADGNLIKAQLPSVNGTLNPAITPINRDSGLDNGIIAHEYGHGISTRLSRLYSFEQMGEGWSDWFGLMMTISPGDIATKRRGIGTYSAFQPTTGNGIRTYPYTTDMGINPFTYNNIATESIPHGVGSVWATMLWDLTWALIDQYGYDSDLYNGTGGNNMAMYLVIEGLKLQPYDPGFVDGRDAILAADELLYNGQNKCLIWQVFARRGLGFSASQGSTGSVVDGTEAFDIPDFYTTGTLQRNYCGTDVLNVNFSNLTNLAISQIEYTINIDGVTSNRTEITNVSSCGSTTISVDLSSLSKGTHVITFTGTNPISPSTSFLVNSNDTGSENVINTFENSVDNLVAFEPTGSTITWERGVAAGTTLSDAVAGGSKVYGTNLSGIHGDNGTYYLVSQCYNLSSLENTVLKFDMAFDIELNYDLLYMEYSIDNGTSWSVLGTATDTNWYNSSTSTCANCIGKQWTGEAGNASTHSGGGINGQMHNYSHSLSAFDATGSAETNIVFRFTYVSDSEIANEGAIVDNFVIEGDNNLSIVNNEFKNLGVFPNPTNDIITIQSSDVLLDAVILIYDVLGRQLNQNINLNTINSNTLTVDFSSFANGTYFLNIKTNEHQSTKQIIKK